MSERVMEKENIEMKIEYSKEYQNIQKEIAEWPEWKKSVYNNSFIISKHAKKIE